MVFYKEMALVTTLSEYCSSGFPKVLMSKLSYSNYEFVCRIRKHILRAGDTSHHAVMCGNVEVRCTLGGVGKYALNDSIENILMKLVKSQNSPKDCVHFHTVKFVNRSYYRVESTCDQKRSRYIYRKFCSGVQNLLHPSFI